MPPINYSFSIRDQAAFPPGTRKTGLAPTWTLLKRLSDNGDISPQPVITEVGQGIYKFTFDAEAHGEAVGQIDAGATLPNPSDRYLDVLLSRDSGRIQAALTANGAKLDLSQPIPLSNLAQTVGDALAAARAAGFGASRIDATVSPPKWVFYAPDGVTPVREFTLNSTVNPTERT
jgi:hypothetical protein